MMKIHKISYENNIITIRRQSVPRLAYGYAYVMFYSHEYIWYSKYGSVKRKKQAVFLSHHHHPWYSCTNLVQLLYDTVLTYIKFSTGIAPTKPILSTSATEVSRTKN